MMEFYVVNTSLETIGIIDSYKSAIWTERYYSSGDFELYVSASPAMLSLIRKNQFIVRMDDPSKAMIVESIKLSTDAESGDYLTITGRSLSSLLSRRIVWRQTTYNGNLEMMLRRMVTDSFIDPVVVARTISFVELGTLLGVTDNVKLQFQGEVVETAIANVCKAHKLGYDMQMDLQNKKIKFVLYKGADRSFDQEENPFVIFSSDFDNLLSSDYVNSDEKYKNVAVVAGEGEGTARKTVEIGEASGLNRFEVFVDEKGQSTNEGEIDATTYDGLLMQKGLERLASLATVETIDSEVAPNHTYKLGVDYFLGDVVEVINEYGIEMTPRVTEVIECQDENGYTCIPTFSSDD